MPQLSPLNWAFLSIDVMTLIFMTMVFFSFMSYKKLTFLNYKHKCSNSNLLKWNW